MEFYEIKNTKTQQTAQTIAKSFAESCKVQGWKPQHCHCIQSAYPENAGNTCVLPVLKGS